MRLTLAYQTEKALSEHGDKLDPSEKKKIEEAIADVKKSLERDDTEDIKTKKEALEQASHTLAQKMYESAQQQAPEGAQGGPAGDPTEATEETTGATASTSDEEVVDAEFEMEEEK